MGMLVLVAHSRDQPWGVLESLSHAVPQWVCGGWVILNDLLTDYILSSGSTFWEGLQWPGRGSRVFSFCWHTLQYLYLRGRLRASWDVAGSSPWARECMVP